MLLKIWPEEKLLLRQAINADVKYPFFPKWAIFLPFKKQFNSCLLALAFLAFGFWASNTRRRFFFFFFFNH